MENGKQRYSIVLLPSTPRLQHPWDQKRLGSCACGTRAGVARKVRREGAQRGPGGESIAGHLDLRGHAPLVPHTQIPRPPNLLSTACFCLPGLRLSRWLGEGLEKIRCAGTCARPALLPTASLSWSQPPLFFLGTASPPSLCLSAGQELAPEEHYAGLQQGRKVKN